MEGKESEKRKKKLWDMSRLYLIDWDRIKDKAAVLIRPAPIHWNDPWWNKCWSDPGLLKSILHWGNQLEWNMAKANCRQGIASLAPTEFQSLMHQFIKLSMSDPSVYKRIIQLFQLSIQPRSNRDPSVCGWNVSVMMAMEPRQTQPDWPVNPLGLTR